MLKKLKYNIAKFFWITLSILPLPLLYIISDIAYILVYRIIGYRKKIVRKNLNIVFPDKDEKYLKGIEKKFYRFFCDTFIESVKLFCWKEKTIKKHMKFVNTEEVNNSLKKGQSVSIFLGHYGNWEWISSLGLWVMDGVAKGQIYKELKSETFNKLMKENREKGKVNSIEMRQTLRWISEQKEAGIPSATGYIADQSPSIRNCKYYINFMGKKTPILTGAEKITKRYGFDAFFLDIKRIKRGYWQGEFIKMHNNPKSLEDFKLTEIFYQLLRNSIYRQPEFYLWSHNRFKNAL